MTPRGVALGLGIAFAVLTGLELLIGELSIGSTELIHRTTKANILHWVIALGMLGAFFTASRTTSRTILRVGGLVLVAISLWGILGADALGAALGFGGGIPLSYNLYHSAGALIALSGGFLIRPERA